MGKSFWIEQVRSGWIVPGFIGKNALQNEDFFSFRMGMAMKGGSRLIAHDGGDSSSFWFANVL
jgi:hypothetical protein